MKKLIKGLYSLKGSKDGTSVDELKSQLGIGTDTPSTDYVKHSLADAANDFIVASAADTFVKKTLAETKTILGLMTYGPQEEIASGESETTLSITKYCSYISTDSGGDTFILPDATMTGHMKKIIMRADGGDSVGDGEGVVTGTFTGEYERLTFNNAGEFALLQWTGTYWECLELGSNIDTTNAPALSS